MRPVALALVLLATAIARAEAPVPPAVPIVVQPFSARCFDATKLAEQVRARVSDVPVSVGKPPRGSHQQVRVAERPDGLSIDVTARDARGRVVGSARRVIPSDDCATALEVAGLIVARAALPLNWREAPEPHAPSHPRRPPPVASNPPETNAPESNAPEGEHGNHARPATPPAGTPGTSEPPGHPPVENTAPSEPAIATPAPPRAFPSGPPAELRPTRAPSPREPGTIIVRLRGPNRRIVGEVDAAVYGTFALDGKPQNPGGEVAVGLRSRHFGAAVRGSIERDWSIDAQSAAGPLSLSLRRAAVALEAHADISVRVGAIRLVVGPMLPLWIVRPGGLPHPHTTTIASFAVAARLLYHLDIGRVFVNGGVDFQVAPTAEDLSVSGVGVIGHTPRLTIGPILALGINL